MEGKSGQDVSTLEGRYRDIPLIKSLLEIWFWI